MADPERKSSGTWKWLIVAIFVAIVAVAVIYYIGWFDNNTHVDTPAGDNVEQQYAIEEAGADQPEKPTGRMPKARASMKS